MSDRKVRSEVSGQKELWITQRRLRKDGHIELAEGYFEQHEALAQHEDILRRLHDVSVCGAGLGYMVHGSDIANHLVNNGWTPPEGLLFVEEDPGE